MNRTNFTIRSFRSLVLAGAVLATLAAGSVGCRSDRVPGFDPRTLDVSKRETTAAQGLAPSQAVIIPQSADETLFNKNAKRDELAGHYKSDPMLQSLSAVPRVIQVDLRTAIQRAVVSNLDVRVAAFQPGIDEARVTEAEARFDPTFITNVGLTRDRSVNFSNSLSARRTVSGRQRSKRVSSSCLKAVDSSRQPSITAFTTTRIRPVCLVPANAANSTWPTSVSN
ncbi:MAG: hypothetical protein QM770_04840 [Tepidisphaeraceae bacterium]